MPPTPQRKHLLSLSLLLVSLSLTAAAYAALVVAADPDPLRLGQTATLTYASTDGLFYWERPCVPDEEAGYRDRLYFPAAGLSGYDHTPNLQCEPYNGEIRCSAHLNQPIAGGEWYTATLHLAPLAEDACPAGQGGARVYTWPVRTEQCEHACGAPWQCASQTATYEFACLPPTLSVSLTTAYTRAQEPIGRIAFSILLLCSVGLLAWRKYARQDGG